MNDKKELESEDLKEFSPFPDYVNGDFIRILSVRYAPVPDDCTDEQKNKNFENILVQESLETGKIRVKIHYKYMSESEREFLGKVAWYLDINHYISVIELTNEELQIVKKVFVLDEEGLELMFNQENYKMNIDLTKKTIMDAVDSGIIELLEPYDELPYRLRVVALNIIEDGGVKNYLIKNQVNDRLKDLINEFIK